MTITNANTREKKGRNDVGVIPFPLPKTPKLSATRKDPGNTEKGYSDVTKPALIPFPFPVPLCRPVTYSAERVSRPPGFARSKTKSRSS